LEWPDVADMTPAQIREYLARLELTQAGCARLLGVDERTMRRWVLGERAMPGPAARLLAVADIREVRRRLERIADRVR
jgi:DNA-binding transcriptional regulator YiaG